MSDPSDMEPFLSMLDGMPHLIFWYTDQDGRIVHSVGGALRPIGLTRDATAGSMISDWGQEQQIRFEQAMMGPASAITTSKPSDVVVRICCEHYGTGIIVGN